MALAKHSRATEPDDLLQIIPKLDPIMQKSFYHDASTKLRLGEKKADRFIHVLIDQGKAFEWLFPRKRARPSIGYSQSRQPTEEED